MCTGWHPRPGPCGYFRIRGEQSDRATEPRLDWPRGMRFRLHAGGEVREARTQLIGRHMIYPALAAVAVGWNTASLWK